ncbi:DUF5688 family protein [Oribacterium sp. P6A1]|uniref:DUF5688 family protein n=1 Tax=Oribacterium sp. P6A1 TaxID=1410612 RepID=UPI00056C9978|nr:DUF5688 family protein [Oribacterium sp. P6A1]
MDFNEFKETFKEDLKNKLSELGINAALSEHHIDKLNQSYEAISATPEGSHIGVNVNLDSIFQSYINGSDYSTVVNNASKAIEAGLNNIPVIDMDNLTNYDVMKDKLTMEVISAERNADMLKNVPHENMEDMAVVYKFILESNGEERSSILVTNNLMNQFGITHEKLHEDAMTNAPEIRPSEIRGMSEVMSSMMGQGMFPEIPPEEEQMFVAGVSDNIHGAGVIAYPNFFEQAAEKLGGDYYILPSSIHEILLVKDNGQMNAADLETMVREVNATQVAPEEQLTNHVYHYDSKEHIFEMADKFEERQAEQIAEKNEAARGSVLEDLKEKKEGIAKDSSGEHVKASIKKDRGGEAL